MLDFYGAHGDAPTRDLPVDQWHPAFCGDIDMRIATNGVWFYNGTPIERPAMVRLFSRILRREDDSYYLVTPVEKVRIAVDDAPFVAVGMNRDGEALTFHTHVGDVVTADADHPLRFEIDADGAVRPYIEVRNALEARLTPAVARELLALAIPRDGWFGISSKGAFFAISANTLTDD
nr:DUF1285 domain-containing protein [Asticcacaulis solisilvae]